MIGWVYVMEPRGISDLAQRRRAPWDRWPRTASKLFQSLACANCHHLDGTRPLPHPGESLRPQRAADRRQQVKADEAYIRESILQPKAKMVAGYQPIMPTFQGLVTEEGVLQLIEYIKSLEPQAGHAVRHQRHRRRHGATNGRTYMITAAVQERENYLNASYGIKSWLLTKDHKRIALLYLFTVTLFFFIGGAFATLIRIELLTPSGNLVSSETYNKLFTMHGDRHDLLLPDPVHPRHARQFLPAHDDRRARPGLPANQPAELVPAGDRRPVRPLRHAGRRRGYRLDLLHALQHALTRTPG